MSLPNFEQLSIRVHDNKLEVLDQTKLPNEEVWIGVKDSKQMWFLIKELIVRGAPLIGVAAVLSLCVDAYNGNYDIDIRV